MEIKASNKIVKLLEDERKCIRKFGSKVAAALDFKISQLQNFPTFASIPTGPPFSKHNLQGKLAGCVAIDIVGRRDKNRIVFRPIDEEGNPISIKDADEVTRIEILGIGDYHK